VANTVKRPNDPRRKPEKVAYPTPEEIEPSEVVNAREDRALNAAKTDAAASKAADAAGLAKEAAAAADKAEEAEYAMAALAEFRANKKAAAAAVPGSDSETEARAHVHILNSI
jgi:hypothetical protein